MKIYVVLSRFPYPLYKGDKLRAYHQIVELSKNHEVYLAALSDSFVAVEDIRALEPFCKQIKIYRLGRFQILFNLIRFFLFSKKPLQVGYFFNAGHFNSMRKDVQSLKPDHLYFQLIRTAAYAGIGQGIPKTLDYMDALSAGMERREEQAGAFMRRIFRLESKRLKRFEHEVLSQFDKACIISKSDRELIFHFDNEAIAVVPNGIDHNHFKASGRAPEYDLLFTGNMAYPPNVQSAQFLVRDIMPLVWKSFPNAKLIIAGATPTAQVKNLASDKVMVLGWVNDIREIYDQCRIFIAPMLIGSGLQNKLLEAMAMEKPCITSELANRSLGAMEGVEILVGRSAGSYADLVIDLLTHPEKAKEFAQKGHSFVTSNYNWQEANKILTNLFENGRTARDR